MNIKTKSKKRDRRHKRIRVKIFGTKERPRLSVFKSNKHIFAQLVDDEKGKTLASASDLKSKTAFEVGKLIAQKARDLKVEKVVFDRAGYEYHGKIKALAEGAREGGLMF